MNTETQLFEHDEDGYHIRIMVSDEIDSPDGGFDFGSAKENAAYLKKFHTGELLNLCIRVIASKDGSEGSDCLGANHVNACDASNDIQDIVKEHGMVATAIEDCNVGIARTNLNKAATPMLEALEHCVAYFKQYKPQYCGIDDDRDCSPYNDAIEAIAKAKGK